MDLVGVTVRRIPYSIPVQNKLLSKFANLAQLGYRILPKLLVYVLPNTLLHYSKQGPIALNEALKNKKENIA